MEKVKVIPTDNEGLTKLVNEIQNAELELQKAYQEYQLAVLDLANEKANWMISTKDKDPKLTVQMLEAKQTATYYAQEKQVLVKKDQCKQKEIELNHLQNTFSVAKRLMELEAAKAGKR